VAKVRESFPAWAKFSLLVNHSTSIALHRRIMGGDQLRRHHASSSSAAHPAHTGPFAIPHRLLPIKAPLVHQEGQARGGTLSIARGLAYDARAVLSPHRRRSYGLAKRKGRLSPAKMLRINCVLTLRRSCVRVDPHQGHRSRCRSLVRYRELKKPARAPPRSERKRFMRWRGSC
jgi:hypothetical protein